MLEVERPLDVVQTMLEARGVAARRPVHRPAHRALGIAGFPEADRLWSCALSVPCYPTLTDGEVDAVVSALREVLG